MAVKLRELEYALRRAERAVDQGQVAKRNARKAILESLRAIRKAVDKQYPVERRKGKPRKRKTPQQRATYLMSNGFARVTNSHMLATLVSAGIKVTVINGADSAFDTYAPRWAITILRAHPGKLREARKSPAFRKETLAAIELRNRDW